MKKLKQQYRTRIPYRTRYEYQFELYPNVRSGVFKHFSTKQEKSYFLLHQIECKEYPIKLRSARGKTLPNYWDEYASSVYDLAKCWKHNSKRRKQYFR